MKIFFFDLETTGTNPGKHGIHQISADIMIDGVVKEHCDWRVRPNPKAIIEQEALAIANVTEEQIMAYPEMQSVYTDLMSTLDKYVNKYSRTDKFFLAGYNNAAFDNQFLRGFFLQNGNKYFGSYFWSNSIDIMVLATYHLLNQRAEMKDFKLATVASTMGIEISEDKLHDASYDLYLTRAIFDKINK